MDGLSITGGSSTVRRLVINRFNRNGVLLEINGGNLIEGNFIGVDVTGSADLGNAQIGVRVENSPANTVGGPTAGALNIISGNDDVGVRIPGPGATDNRVQGNFIGTDRSGTSAIGNALFGVIIDNGAERNFIGTDGDGSTDHNEGNLISGNVHGVSIQLAGHNVVAGNLIGTDVTGTGPLSNTGPGVFVASAARFNTIGGTMAGTGNTIAYNGNTGVLVTSPSSFLPLIGNGNAILSNSIFSIAGLGIDLVPPVVTPPGVTPNDPGDDDTGPNDLMNFPVLTSALATSGRLLVRGTIDTPNPETVTIEFFANSVPTPGGDPSGHGEGAVFLGRASPNPVGGITATLPVVEPGTLITATATDAAGNTSEFAANVMSTAPALSGG